MSDYVRVLCPECEASVKVEADSLGEEVTCPKCDQDFVAREKGAPKRPAAKPKARPRDEEEDERPRRRRRDEEDDERPTRKGGSFEFDNEDEDEDDRPRRRGPRAGVCPNCGNTRSTKVAYTWWGGLLGPAMMGLVKCSRCAKQYVKSTGKPLGAGPIIIYSVVIFVLCVVIFGALGLAAR